LVTKHRDTWTEFKAGDHAFEPRHRPYRSQSTHSSEEAGQLRGSEGVQGGGAVTFMATDDKPVKVPERANRIGKTQATVLWIEPLEGTRRLLTALESRDKAGTSIRLLPQRGLNALFAEQGLSGSERAHALVPSILAEVKPPTGEPGAGNPPARFGGGRGRT
jgi:hypothetical protein